MGLFGFIWATFQLLVKSTYINVLYHTWITYFISVIGTFQHFFYGLEHLLIATWQDFKIDYFMVSSNFFNATTWEESAVFLSLMLIILPMTIAFVQIIDIFSKNLCLFVPSNCFPVIEKTELEVERIKDDLP